MRYLRAFFTGLVAILGLKTAEAIPAKSQSDMMRELRIGWLSRVPEKGSYQREEEVVAVLMDWPLGDQIVTVHSSSGGDASLYTTGSFGIIGGVGHERVRKAAIEFVACAEHFLGEMNLTDKFPYPDSKTVRFYVVTPAGVRTVSFPMVDVERAGSSARALFSSAQQVVTELREITPK